MSNPSSLDCSAKKEMEEPFSTSSLTKLIDLTSNVQFCPWSSKKMGMKKTRRSKTRSYSDRDESFGQLNVAIGGGASPKVTDEKRHWRHATRGHR